MPCVWRHISQWQKCVGSGREEVGRVKERVVRLQRQWAFSVAVDVGDNGDDADGGVEGDILDLGVGCDRESLLIRDGWGSGGKWP